MLSKELEILRTIEELYSGDISEEEFIKLCKGKETKVQAWKEAFQDYDLYDITKAINHYYVKKSSKTRPNIAQITAILQENNARKEEAYEHFVVEPSLGIQYQMQDKADGNMHWFVTDYLEVERLIREDYWGWVYNINQPSLNEFHQCLEEWCKERTGHKYRFYSDNDIAKMSEEEKQALWQKCHDIFNGLEIKKLN